MKQYGVDFVNKKIWATKAFMKKAENPHNAEYKELRAAIIDNPGYAAEAREIKKNGNKQKYAGLTEKMMRKYIGIEMPNKLNEFEKQSELADCRKNRYAYLKKWFILNCGEKFNALDDEYKKHFLDLKEKKEEEEDAAAEKECTAAKAATAANAPAAATSSPATEEASTQGKKPPNTPPPTTQLS